MSSPSRPEALPPVETAPGTLVHTSADRRLAAEHWLAATHPNAAQVRWEWQHRGLALLPLGGLFCAVRLPDRLVRAVAAGARKDPAVYLIEELRGGPVIHNRRHEQYHALVPRSMPDEWAGAVAEWPTWGAECLGRGTYLGVPPLDAVADAPGRPAYWAVPMPSAGELCDPVDVATLVTAGSWYLDREAAEASPETPAARPGASAAARHEVGSARQIE
ncbi:hypothetical protein ACFWHW_03565 [Streptomyces pharetrae]|uniref:hypothetical protein n=1 Tax=Streptomyces pharetrae TaxID=291370 RepID=UPI0036687B20